MWNKSRIGITDHPGLMLVALVDIIALHLCFLYGLVAFYMARASYFLSYYSLASYSPTNKLSIKEEDLKRILQAFLSYVRGESSSAQIALNIDNHLQTFFNEKELSHLADIAILFDGFKILAIISLVLAILLTAILICKIHNPIILLKAWLLNAFLIATATALATISYAMSSFTFISRFHQLFFSNSLWIMGSSDSLSAFFPSGIYGRFIHTIAYGLGGLNLVLFFIFLAVQKPPEKLLLLRRRVAIFIENLACLFKRIIGRFIAK